MEEKLDNDTIYNVAKKILGAIEPCGDTHIDSIRLDNLINTIDLAERLFTDIASVSYDRHRPEYSVKELGDEAYKFIKNIYDTIGTYLGE